MSFQITISPNRRAAARFVGLVRRALLKAYVEQQKKTGMTQTKIANALGVHRSVINRELKGTKDLTLGRVAELAWTLGKTPTFELREPTVVVGQNHLPHFAPTASSPSGVTSVQPQAASTDGRVAA